MAELLRYVDPDAAGTGSGLDWTNAYTSLAAWQIGEVTDLVSASDWMHVYVRASSGTDDTTLCRISGWTTGVSNNIVIEAEDGDQAIVTSFDSSRYVLTVAGAGCLKIEDDYVTINGLQFDGSSLNSFDACVRVLSIGASSDIQLTNNRMLFTANVDGYGFYTLDADANIYMGNNIIEDTSGAFNDYGFRNAGGNDLFYNNIVTGFNRGLRTLGDGTTTSKNCALFNNNDDVLTADIMDYCASDDGDGTNAISPSGSDWANEYPNWATGNYTPTNGGNCYLGGLGPTADANVITPDMSGNTRSGATSTIGANEYVVVGGISIPVVMNQLRNQGVA